jgi:thiamine-phosphate pyrophosphorylase
MPSDVPVHRILDAATNRAAEGLRVVEDYVRFVLDDRHLTELAKDLRHELASAAETFSPGVRAAARDTLADVGVTVTTVDESLRSDALHVCHASLERTKQSLRSLEEYSKTVAAATAEPFEALRYRLYTFEAALLRTVDALERLDGVRLYVLVDACESEAALAGLVEQLVAGGVGAIQLRDKSLGDRTLIDRARKLVISRDQAWSRLAGSSTSAALPPRPLVVINDRPDVAAAVGADGVHLGQEDMSLKDARRIVGARTLIGVSTHSLEQARLAVLEGANYIGVGPTFPSTTKQFAEHPGVELLRSVAAEIRLPAFAIGGISLQNVDAVRSAGFLRIAVASAVAGAENPRRAAEQLHARICAG